MESDIFIWDEKLLTDSAYENTNEEKAYKAVPPPTGTIIPPRANVSFTGIDELAIRNKVVNQEKTKSSQPEIDRNKVIIEDWVDSDDEETDVSESQKETVFNSENSEWKKSLKTGHQKQFYQKQLSKESGQRGLGTKGGSRETRPVWNNIQRVNHSNFSRNSRYPHQRRSFTPSAVLTRDGLISTARPKMTQTVPSKSTANVTYQGTARSRVPQAALSRSTDGSYYPRMDNRRPRISSYSPSSRSSTTRTPHRPHRPKKIVKSIWVKKGSTVESQAVLPQTVKKSAMINPKQTWRPKGNYLDSCEIKSNALKLSVTGQSRRRSKGHASMTVDLLEKQTIVAYISTEAENVHCKLFCSGHVDAKILDYGFNFMNTEIHIDNESTICIVRNPVLHSKTKHIQIRHHFIRDCYEQRLINVVKVHTDDNVADLLTKGFDLARFNFLVVTIGMMNP
ncbi:hypothetical protein Tco_0824845 [Tanacetum coccineum]